MKPERIQKQLQAHPGWKSAFPSEQLIRSYEFPTFQGAVRLLNVVSRSAGNTQHAIEATLKGGSVTLVLSSANDGMLTDSQFALAGVIDDAVAELETDVAA